MIGNALPVRFSQRIKRNASLLPVRVSPKRKIRKPVVKKRASGANSSLLKEKKKTKVGGKNKLEKIPNQEPILKRASHNLKPISRKSLQISISKICDKKPKTRNSVKISQVNFKNNKASLKNLELFDKVKKVNEKKNYKKFVNEEKQSVYRSSRLSESSLKKKGKNNELSESDLKSSKVSPSQKKSTKQVTTLSSESVFTPNPGKCAHTPKLLERRKSARLSTKPWNQEISVHMHASKSFAGTPVPGKVTPISRPSGNRKSARLSKESQNQELSVNTPASKLLALTPVPGNVTRLSRHSGNRKSRKLPKEPNSLAIMNSEISLNTSPFHSLLETPQPEKHPEKRKSSRSLEPSPLRTLNKELPLSTPASILRRNANSTLNKSTKSCKSVEHLSSESRSRKQSKPKASTKDGSTVSHEKQKPKVNRKKTSKNFKKPLSNETENLPLDIFTTPAFKPPFGRNLSKKYLSKSDSRSSQRKLNTSASENPIGSEELQDAKKRKSAGDNVCVDSSTSPLKCRSMKKSISPGKTNHTSKLINYGNFESYLMPAVNIQGKMDVLTADLLEKKSRRRARSVPFKTEIDCLSTYSKGKGKYINSSEKKVKSMPCGNVILSSVGERKGKSTGNLKRKPVKRPIPHVMSPNVISTLSSKTSSNKIIKQKVRKSAHNLKRKPVKRLLPHFMSPNLNSALSIQASSIKTVKPKALQIKSCLTKKHNIHETPQVSSPPVNMDCLTADLYKAKHRRTKSDEIGLLCERGTFAFSKKRWIKTLSPIKFTPNVNLNNEPNMSNSKLGTLFPLPVDDLTAIKSASSSPNGDGLVVNVLSPCYTSKKKTHSWPLGNELSSEISAKDDFPKIPAKGTLKRKRWLLNNLTEKNGSYEDDIFENKNFDLYKQAFHFGDESDGSSVNIATPKFDCILTPALPKKTPRFKDCISPTEFLQARKTAEEYLYRRNKKRKSGDRPSSSGKKTSVNKRKTVQEIPEKKKLDFEEAVNKLIAVQKNLETEAEVDDEEEDSYFSDTSN